MHRATGYECVFDRANIYSNGFSGSPKELQERGSGEEDASFVNFRDWKASLE